ncbi:Hypothetical protein SRAE_1000171800 [Strongyloides ratti]|uniref:Uncharacterized protein n=1 Tax=Strongyloides ratti TaxID=34506 RepID=A0A090L174_STRRB|nr:Hypothetical protein SRAE_1000171800 [Strongyloides ratti]CEF63456.1 Hypothetical protein SRAE_1000171800 [Strongyloides ratti]
MIKNTNKSKCTINQFFYKINDIINITILDEINIRNNKYYFLKISTINDKEKFHVSWNFNINRGKQTDKWKYNNIISEIICSFNINSSIFKLQPIVLTNLKSFLFYDYIIFLSFKKYQKIIVHIEINQKRVLSVSKDASSKKQFNQNKFTKIIAYVFSNKINFYNEWYFIEKDNYFTDTLKLSDYSTSITIQNKTNENKTDKNIFLYLLSLPPIDMVCNINKLKNTKTILCKTWTKKSLIIQSKSRYINRYSQKTFKIWCLILEKEELLNNKDYKELHIFLHDNLSENLFKKDIFLFFIQYVKKNYINIYKYNFFKQKLKMGRHPITFILINCSNKESFPVTIKIYNLYNVCIFGKFLICQIITNNVQIAEEIIHLVKKYERKKKFFDSLFKIHAFEEKLYDNEINTNFMNNIYIKLKKYDSSKLLNDLKNIQLKKLPYHYNKRLQRHFKRNINTPERTKISRNLSESGANTILVAYDVLLNKNQDIADVYLQNIDDIIKVFCQDQNIEDEKKATGGLYTFIQTQIVIVNNNTIIYQNMTMAGSDKYMFSLSKDFYSLIYQFYCGVNSNDVCEKICIGTSLIGIDGIEINIYFRQKLFSTNNLLASYNNLVSDLRHVYLIDNLSGSFLNIPPYTIWNAQIPIHNYSPSNYYSCMLYKTSSWDNFNSCTTNDYAYSLENSTRNLINCTCSGNGIIGVFHVPPPKPKPYSIYQEILLYFKLSSPVKCDPIKLSKFFSSLSSLVSVPINRFIKEQCSKNSFNDTISIILRPLMKDNDQSNAYIIQSIQRLINNPNGLIFSDKIKILSVYPNVINRNLTNDGNARQVHITIDKKFEDVVFNDTLLINIWIKEISDSLGISQYRIKDPKIFKGIIFEFTITIPFEGEISLIGQILSAEELSQILLEQTTYNELILKDLHDEILPIKKMKQNDIIELVVLYQASPLLIILGSVIGGLLLITIFGVLGLVILKIRNDKLIAAASNNGIVTVNLNNMTRTTVTPTPQTVFVDQNSIV